MFSACTGFGGDLCTSQPCSAAERGNSSNLRTPPDERSMFELEGGRWEQGGGSYIPMEGSIPLFFSSLNSWHSAQVVQKRWRIRSSAGASTRLYLSRRLLRWADPRRTHAQRPGIIRRYRKLPTTQPANRRLPSS